MRKLILSVLSCIACVSGCQFVGFKDECYYRWECGRLPIVKTTTPILVNPASQVHEAQALGAAAGPIQQGQFIQGGKGAQPMQLLMLPRADAQCGAACPPCYPNPNIANANECSTPARTLPQPKPTGN